MCALILYYIIFVILRVLIILLCIYSQIQMKVLYYKINQKTLFPSLIGISIYHITIPMEAQKEEAKSEPNTQQIINTSINIVLCSPGTDNPKTHYCHH